MKKSLGKDSRLIKELSSSDAAKTQVAEVFANVARLVARGFTRIDRDLICCGDVTLQQFETLREIQTGGPALTGALADRLGIDLSTASRNLAVLERNGYVARTPTEEDGRAVKNRLTSKGERCVTSLSCDEQVVFGSILDRVPPHLTTRVIKALEVLARAMELEERSSNCDNPVKEARRRTSRRSA
jgi:DNA-binding MarR family transcriptional regulator